MVEWPLRTIGDLVTLQRGIDLPDHSRNSGSVPIMGSFGITGRHNVAACKGPGVTVGRSGASAGTVCYIEEDYWPLNTCLYVRDFKGNHPRFAYYFLTTVDLAGMNSGSAQPSLNRNFVHPMPVRFPEPSEQQAIAAVLSALDDKIELNRRMNDTLEASARALFRDWFVDFGPARAKAEGRNPYLAPELWSRFPGGLDDKGKPVGWQQFRLEELADYRTGSINPAAQPDTLFEHYSLPAYDTREQPALDLGSTIKSNKTQIPSGAILLSKLNPETPRVWIPDLPAGRPQVASTEFLAFVPKKKVGMALVYSLFNETAFRQTLAGMVTGTSKSHQRVSPGAVTKLTVLTADPAIFGWFEKLAAPMLDQILANRVESRTLARTRDLLLPKLMSGEIRVSQAKKQAGDRL